MITCTNNIPKSENKIILNYALTLIQYFEDVFNGEITRCGKLFPPLLATHVLSLDPRAALIYFNDRGGPKDFFGGLNFGY